MTTEHTKHLSCQDNHLPCNIPLPSRSLEFALTTNCNAKILELQASGRKKFHQKKKYSLLRHLCLFTGKDIQYNLYNLNSSPVNNITLLGHWSWKTSMIEWSNGEIKKIRLRDKSTKQSWLINILENVITTLVSLPKKIIIIKIK